MTPRKQLVSSLSLTVPWSPCSAWRDMAEATNHAASNLTASVRDAALTTQALLRGDTTARASATMIGGEFRELREGLNELAEQHQNAAKR